MEEVWKSIFDGWYAVSNFGRVKRVMESHGGRSNFIRKPSINSRGYANVCLGINGRQIVEKIHRLVAEAFIGPKPNGFEVNHKDGNKLNNRVQNLEYVTHAENMRHASRCGLLNGQIGTNNGNSKLTEANVSTIKKLRREGLFQREIAKRFSISQAHVSYIVLGKSWGWVK